MKDFILKYKWIIATVIAILAEVSKLVGLPAWLVLTIQIVSIALTVLQQRAEGLNEVKSAQYDLMRYDAKGGSKKPFIKVTIFSMLKDQLIDIVNDFKEFTFSSYIKNKYDIHNIAGLGIGLMICCIPFPHWFLRLVSSTGGAWVAGFLNEGYQFTKFKALTDSRDMRMTGYGGLIAVPVFIGLVSVGLPVWSILLIGLLLLGLSFMMNKRR